MNERIASKKRTRQILEDYDFHTKKRFGQNFIVESGVVDKIANAVAGQHPDGVIEIGPGIGALTEALVQHFDPVEVYEIDEKCIPVLENEVGKEHLIINQQDFLEADLKEIAQRHPGNLAFVSNLPYYITTPILFKLFEAEIPVGSITVMMQKEVADRFMAPVGSKSYNALSVITQYLCDMDKVMDVNRNVFWPSPNVESSVLQFTFKPDRPLSVEQQQDFFNFVKAAFTQRRKTLFNNLQSLIPDKQKLAELIEQAGLKSDVRAQNMELNDFLRLFKLYENAQGTRES